MFNQNKLLNDVEKNLINFLTELSLAGEGDKHIASFTVEHHTYGTWINLMYKTNLFAEDQYLEVIPLEINELKKKREEEKIPAEKEYNKIIEILRKYQFEEKNTKTPKLIRLGIFSIIGENINCSKTIKEEPFLSAIEKNKISLSLKKARNKKQDIKL